MSELDEKLPEKLLAVYTAENGRIRLELSTSQDRMKLFLAATPLQRGVPLDPPLGLNELKQLLALPLLRNASLDEQVLTATCELLSSGSDVPPRRIARGTPPRAPRDGRLVLLIKKLDAPIGKGDGDFVDQKYIHTFDNVEVGMTVARLYPPMPGSPGSTVFGDVIAAEGGKQCQISLDDSLKLLPPEKPHGYQTIVAQRSGYLSEKRGLLQVVGELQVASDINYRTGDISFVGSVKIRGNVSKDFSVTARGDLEIVGEVFHASLCSERESISVSGSVTGETLTQLSTQPSSRQSLAGKLFRVRPALVRACKRFSTPIARGIEVEAGESIHIKREASYCSFHTRGAVIAPEAHLFAGSFYIVEGLEARILGTPSESPTQIVLCSGVESSREYTNLVDQIREHESAEALLALHLGPFAENQSRLPLLHEPYQTKIRDLLAKLNRVRSSLGALREKQRQLLGDSARAPIVRVNFRLSLHRGVVIRAQEKEFAAAADLAGPGTIEFDTAAQTFTLCEYRPLSDARPSAEARKV